MEETCQQTIEKQEWLAHGQWNIMERQLVLTESKTCLKHVYPLWYILNQHKN